MGTDEEDLAPAPTAKDASQTAGGWAHWGRGLGEEGGASGEEPLFSVCMLAICAAVLLCGGSLGEEGADGVCDAGPEDGSDCQTC